MKTCSREATELTSVKHKGLWFCNGCYERLHYNERTGQRIKVDY